MDTDQNESSLTGSTMGKSRETLNKSILAPLRHGFSRRGIDGYAFIQRIPSTATQRQTAKATYDPILLQSVGYLINWYRTRMKQTRRLSVERHDLINKGANKNEA